MTTGANQPPLYKDMPLQNGAPGESEKHRAVAESEDWLLATGFDGRPREDSRNAIEALGFIVLGKDEANPLFYKVVPPAGLSKSTEGYWTCVKDAKGKIVLSQFHKGAAHDTQAWIKRTI